MDLFGYYTWKVEVEGGKPGPEEDYTLYFQDRQLFLDDISKGYYVAQFMKDVMNKVEEQDHYDNITKIKKITSADDKDMTKVGEILVLLGSHSEMGKMGFLFGYNETGDAWEILGVYPEQYARAVKDNKALLHTYLELIVLKPDFWDNFYILR